jgi:hypothetical protein
MLRNVSKRYTLLTKEWIEHKDDIVFDWQLDLLILSVCILKNAGNVFAH